MAIANTIIKELGFVEMINERVKWDRAHWNISPGGLAKMLVMSTFSDIRVPMTHLEDRLEGIDTEFFLAPEDKSNYVNESNVGEALDRIGETDYDGLYETLALSALRQYEIPITRMHGDTTTVSFYGEYDIEKMELSQEEKEALLHLEKGYNKDGRLGCNQMVVGQIVNEHGIPVVSKTLDGATSDVDWNREAIRYVAQIAASGFEKGVFVADCKLVTEEHIGAMNHPQRRISFVSRCPVNFCDTLERRTIAKAYANGMWEEIDALSTAKDATQYRVASFMEEVNGWPMRLLVVESDTLRQQTEEAIEKQKEELTRIAKALEKKQWMCQADAQAERDRFLAMKQAALFDSEIVIEKRVVEKWPKGRRGADTKPTVTETYHLHVEKVTRCEPSCQAFIQRESCFVLISNVTDGMSEENLLKTYKGQQVVENSFRMLKGPQLASVIYLKNPARIQVLTMLLTFSLLLRALIQHRLREGLSAFEQEHPGQTIRAGWGGRPLKNPTFKLLYEHSVNCCFERVSFGRYTFAWPTEDTMSRVEPLLSLMGLSLEKILM